MQQSQGKLPIHEEVAMHNKFNELGRTHTL